MRTYKPVEVRALPWAAVLKEIAEFREKGVAVRDLVRLLNVAEDDPALLKAIEQLVASRRVRQYFGVDEKGRAGTVVQGYGERETKRDRVGFVDAGPDDVVPDVQTQPVAPELRDVV